MRDQVTHRKEIKLRAERKRKEWLTHCEQCRRSLIEKILPLPVKPDMYMDIVLWRLFWGEFFNRPGFYFPKNQRACDKLNQIFQKLRMHLSLSSIILNFRLEIHRGVYDNLWEYDKEPMEKELINLISMFEKSWRNTIASNNQSFIKAIRQEILIEKTGNVERLSVR